MLGHDLLATCRALGPGSGVSWSIGECAKAFGLSTATLRAWETRYGLEPSDRSAGGHQPFTSTYTLPTLKSGRYFRCKT